MSRTSMESRAHMTLCRVRAAALQVPRLQGQLGDVRVAQEVLNSSKRRRAAALSSGRLSYGETSLETSG